VDNSGSVNTSGRRSRQFPERVVGALVRVVGLVLATLLAQSFFWSPANPFSLKVGVATVGLLASFRPDVALLVLAGIAPFGRLLSSLTSPAEPVAITEALALAYLADGP